MRARNPLTASILALAAFAAAPLGAAAQTPANDAPLSLTVHPAFHVAVGLAHTSWSDGALSGANGISVTASRHITGPFRVAFDFATVSGNTLSGSGVESARHYFVNAALAVAPELSAGGRLVQPQLGIGIGTVVSDPAAASSTTRSQNAWAILAGVDVGLSGPFTLGLQYRRVAVSLQDVAAQGPQSTGTPVDANVVELRLGILF